MKKPHSNKGSGIMSKFTERVDLGKLIDRKSFMLGMITAFAECVAGECKKVAFSSPFYPEDYHMLIDETRKIIKEQGLNVWYEENLDLPEEVRVNWFVIYKFPEVLDEYKEIRNQGYNPAYDFNMFKKLLSYGIVYGENSDKVVPKKRKDEEKIDTISRVLFKPGDWPLKRK